MESETTMAEEAARQMDEMIASVMPDSHEVHARIYLAGKNLSKEQQEFALDRVRNALDQHPNAPAEKVADLVLEKVDF